MAQFPGMMPPKTKTPPKTPPSFRAKPGSRFPPRRGPMMADGGPMGSPSPIGGDEEENAAPPAPAAGAGAAPPPPPGLGADTDQDNDFDNPVVRPESVNYHDDPQTCETCQYMADSGQCSVLRMQVSPQGGCNAFEPKAGGGEEGEDMMPGEGPQENAAGTSGYQMQ